MKSWKFMTEKERVLAMVNDLAGQFLYYDRKEDHSFPVGRIEELVRAGVITIDEMVAEFRSELEKSCK